MIRPFFAGFGKKSLIFSALRIDGMRNITIGDRVQVSYRSWLAAVAISDDHPARLVIGSGSVIGHFNHIYATNEIIIEENVLTADKVYISDNLHLYEDIDVPVLHQRIKQLNKVRVGAGSWIGENVCIMGCSIGKNCVIGANSVVTKDIPDYSVAVGIPAKIIKRFNTDTGLWMKTEPDGSFKTDQ
jgi:acetyltransferase-like isoleucine patch superfamily enzyme